MINLYKIDSLNIIKLYIKLIYNSLIIKKTNKINPLYHLYPIY